MIATRLGVGVTTGAGLLARRPDGLLFVASTTFAGWPTVVDDFIGSADAETARDTVTASVVDASFVIDPFVMVTWDDHVHVHVLGDIVVTTDLATLPMLSGRGSASWVEHRAPRLHGPCRLWVGASPGSVISDLGRGTVPADGFVVQLDPSGPAAPTAVAPTAVAPTAVAPIPVAPTAVAPTPVATDPAGMRSSGLAALNAATGGDWMEDSLGLPPLQPPQPAPSPPATGVDDLDPEITLDPQTFATSKRQPEPVTTSRGQRTVQARRCAQQHLNPPGSALCRVCREPIDPRQPIDVVAQPSLGSLILPDGRSLEIDGAIVIGRNPDAASAHEHDSASLCRLDVGNDVSRTHVVVRANGWVLEAVDCGSSGQTVLVSAAAATPEPTMLEPWMAHELSVGDALYLGGPTKVALGP